MRSEVGRTFANHLMRLWRNGFDPYPKLTPPPPRQQVTPPVQPEPEPDEDKWGFGESIGVDATRFEDAIMSLDPRFELVADTFFFTDETGRYLLEISAWDVTDSPHYQREGYEERAEEFEAEYPPIGAARLRVPATEESER